MFTNTAKKAIASMVTSCASNSPGVLSFKGTNGTTYYFTGGMGWPYTKVHTVSFNNVTAGIQLGTGNTAESGEDYCLESIITSGLSGAMTESRGENNGKLYLALDIVVTNTSSAAITIREIGYAQNVNGTTTQQGTSGSGRVTLIDRTVLDTPITIAAGDSETIRYMITEQ